MTAVNVTVRLGAALVVIGMLAPLADGAQSQRHVEGSNRSSAPALSYFGNSIGSAVASDGKRYAAYFVADRSVRVLNERGRTLTDFVVPADPYPLPRTVEDVGGGYVLLGDSASSFPRPKLVQIATGMAFDVDPRPWLADWSTGSVSLTGVGRNWISGEGVTSHGGAHTFLNWRTGRVANDLPTYYEPANTARRALDLNTAELWRPMCKPLHRRSSHNPETGEGRGIWQGYQYRPPLGLTTSSAGRLLLERCRQRKVAVLSRCRRGCGFAQLGAGIATWREGSRAYFYRARTRCGRSWKIPAPDSHVSTLAHTSSRIFISTIDPESYGRLQPRPVWRIYTAAIPSC